MGYARRDDWAPSAVTAAPPRVFLASHARPSPHSRLGVARAVFAHDSPTIRLRAQPRDENDAAGDDAADEDDDLSEWLTLVSWCSLAAFMGCGIASAVYFVQSRETTRPAKVRAYNAEAAAWRDELAAAYASKWTPPAGASPPRLRVVRGADADAGAPAVDEAMTLELVGPAARGEVLVIEGHGDLTGRHPPMRGDHGTDYARLERGAALVTVVENFHAVERRTEIAERARVQVGDDASGFEVSVPAMRCEAAPSQYGHSAVSVFLRTITLVENSPANEAYAGLEAVEGGYACALEYTEPSKEVRGYHDARDERDVEAMCRDSARIPRKNVNLTVVVRSPEDPHLVRGELTGCDYYFGVGADALAEKTRRVGFAALALFGLLVILLGFISRRKIRRAAKASRAASIGRAGEGSGMQKGRKRMLQRQRAAGTQLVRSIRDQGQLEELETFWYSLEMNDRQAIWDGTRATLMSTPSLGRVLEIEGERAMDALVPEMYAAHRFAEEPERMPRLVRDLLDGEEHGGENLPPSHEGSIDHDEATMLSRSAILSCFISTFLVSLLNEMATAAG